MKNKQRIISILVIVLLLISVIVGTYAFFAADVTGNETESTMKITAAETGIMITFIGGDEENLIGIYPREAAWLEKDITITSTASPGSTLSQLYTFNLVVDESDYEENDIMYTFTPKEISGVDAGYTQTNYLTNLETKHDIAHGYVRISNESTITYTLRVYYINKDDFNQNDGTSKTAKFHVTYTWGNPVRLTYNLNGGSITGSDETVIVANSTIKIEKPKKEGYKFTGWIVTGGSIVGDELTATEEDVVLTASYRELTQLEKDSWETIAANVRGGNTSMYSVGDTKCVKVEGITSQIDNGCDEGEFAVRLVNNSTPSECNMEGFSQTACGFVLEFTSIIENHNMNPAGIYKGTNYPNGWNVDGWPATAMYKYVNGTKNGSTWDRTNTLFSKLEPDLQNVIQDTYTVSGHGSTTGEQNFESTDKLYLLSTKEIWGNCGDGANCSDTATNVTRQLDWYNEDSTSGRTQVTTSNYDESLINTPIKYYQSAQWYWLRSAYDGTYYHFYNVSSNGSRGSHYAGSTDGVAPAFRIG